MRQYIKKVLHIKRDVIRIFKSFATHLNTEKNQLVSISISEVEIKNDVNGTKTKQKIPNTSRTIPCDILFIAIGFTGPKIHPSLKKIDFKRVSFNSKEYVTNDSKYYLLGDARIGQSLVVNALAEGRNIVNEIDRKLNLDRGRLINSRLLLGNLPYTIEEVVVVYKQQKPVLKTSFYKEGGDILSHRMAVPSALMGLTTLFGKVRGEPHCYNHLKSIHALGT